MHSESYKWEPIAQGRYIGYSTGYRPFGVFVLILTRGEPISLARPELWRLSPGRSDLPELANAGFRISRQEDGSPSVAARCGPGVSPLTTYPPRPIPIPPPRPPAPPSSIPP